LKYKSIKSGFISRVSRSLPPAKEGVEEHPIQPHSLFSFTHALLSKALHLWHYTGAATARLFASGAALPRSAIWCCDSTHTIAAHE